MPMYDWECKKCKNTHTEMLSFEKYKELVSVLCSHCGKELTVNDRILGVGLKVCVRGTSKGNYNSRA